MGLRPQIGTPRDARRRGVRVDHIAAGLEDGTEAPLRQLEHALQPRVAIFVMPVFAFANAGVHLGNLTFADMMAPIPLGIAFTDADHAAAVRLGVLTGSILSALVGYTVLRLATGPASVAAPGRADSPA